MSPDLGPLLARFANADAVAWDNMRLALKASAEDLVAALAAASPRGNGASDKRRLADSWELIDQGFQFRVRNTAPHLRYVLKGSNYPHQGGGTGWIYPVRAQALRFTIDGQVFFRRRVRAYAGEDFVTPVVRGWRVATKGILGAHMKVYVHWLAGR
jgi:hypothetical protein